MNFIKRNLARIFIAGLFIAFTSNQAFSLSAKQMIKISEKKIRGNSQISIYDITIKTRRWTRTMRLKSFENRRQRKSLAEIYKPRKDAGNRFLLIKDRMWQYVPSLGQIIRISPTMMLQSWMGSDFTNDDIVKQSSIVDDYIHSIGGKETINGHSCYKIILKPKKNAAVVWGKIIYYVRVNDYLPAREEFYNQHNILKKVMNMYDYKYMHNRVIPTRYRMQTIRKKNRYTEMKILKVRFNPRIPNHIFSRNYLKRR